MAIKEEFKYKHEEERRQIFEEYWPQLSFYDEEQLPLERLDYLDNIISNMQCELMEADVLYEDEPFPEVEQ